ncbi:uncharacterized protein LOC128556961 [Mercenaria mercenaria]|uniref:uncharacterized protein LOC128556961 n=1 Tax=Mercenaria mercenaria TaxID=6596 RepID=UPI00234F2DEB|nr:uncharacterized protein LOC128556961 [Mercenaria mercenaria]
MATANKRNTKRQDYKKMHEGIELDVEVFDNSIKHEPVITTNTSGGASLEPEDTQMSHTKETHENGDLATSKEEDEEMRLIEQAIEAAEAEKQEILKTRKKEELRAQLRRKQLEVKQLKEEGNAVYQLDIEPNPPPVPTPKRPKLPNHNKSEGRVTINTLRKNSKLSKKVNQQMKQLGLTDPDLDVSNSDSDSESETDSSTTSSSDSSDTESSSDSEIETKKKHKKSTKKSKSKKSGIKAKSSDKVKFAQKYPHSQLRYEFVSRHISFQDLNLNLFVAGELEIISEKHIKSKERSGRLKLLKRLMDLSSTYSFSILKSYYAAVLREIELGEKS